MQRLAELQDSLKGTALQYFRLKKKFAEFTESLRQLEASSIEGLTVTPNLEADHVDIYFVGITFRLVFSVGIAGEIHRPIGVVHCYSIVEQPEKTCVETGRFTFKPDGVSDLKDSDDDKLCIDHYKDAMHIGLHLVRQALNEQIVPGKSLSSMTLA